MKLTWLSSLVNLGEFRGTYERTNWGTFVLLQAQDLNHALQIPALPTLSFGL